MGYLETLQSHNTRLSTLVDKANSLPEAGGSGGGVSVETVTLTIVNNSSAWVDVIYYVFVDNTPMSLYGSALDEDTVVFENVISGSKLVLASWDDFGTIKVTGGTAYMNGPCSWVCELSGASNSVTITIG